MHFFYVITKKGTIADMVLRTFDELKKILPDPTTHTTYTLNRMFRLLAFLDNPQNKLVVIHVAGTSGKTSTAYYIAALLQAKGKKVGLTVSPHVVEINDRVQIGLVPLKEEVFCSEFSIFLDTIKECKEELTYFECMIAFAYWEFARQHVEYVVVEVGLGGTLDGTNTIHRSDKVCVITDIGLDHIQVLGSTLTAIARQKAGIIHRNNSTFSYKQSPAIRKILNDTCQKQQADLHEIVATKTPPDLLFLPLFQRRNFYLAHVVVDYVLQRDAIEPLTKTELLQAAHVDIPGRMEIFHKYGKTIIIDGAHNGQKLQALVRSVRAQFPESPIAVLVSFANGSEYRLPDALRALASLTQHLIVTSFGGEQDAPKHSTSLKQLADRWQHLTNLQAEIIQKPEDAIHYLETVPEPVLLITGSFYLLNHIRPRMLQP